MDDLDTTNGDGHTGQFDRRIVNAAGAPPAATPGAVSSPFSMAAQYAAASGLDLTKESQAERPSESPAAAAAADVAAKPPATPMARAKLTLQACGELTTEQLAETLEIDLKTASKVVQNGITKGYWARVTGADGVKRIKLTTPPPRKEPRARKPKAATAPAKKAKATEKKPRGFKRWLSKRGEQPAAPRSKPAKAVKPAKRTTRPSAPANAPAKPRVARLPAPSTAQAAPHEPVSCALFNNGTLLISNETGSVDLSKAQARQVVAYLELIASALQE